MAGQRRDTAGPGRGLLGRATYSSRSAVMFESALERDEHGNCHLPDATCGHRLPRATEHFFCERTGPCAASCVQAVLRLRFCLRSARLGRPAQEEVYHPGETYDSLQAGRDSYFDAEAERRAKIGRQLMLEEQIQALNTWSDPQDKYRPVRPESYGPIRPKVYLGPTLADVYAYPQSAIVYYNAPASAPSGAVPRGQTPFAAPVPVFQAWPRVPGDIWGTPYYGYVRQPIGHVKIWTGRASYIYKPVYASPAMESAGANPPSPVSRRVAPADRPRLTDSPASPGAPPPPPKPLNPGLGAVNEQPDAAGGVAPKPNSAAQGQEI